MAWCLAWLSTGLLIILHIICLPSFEKFLFLITIISRHLLKEVQKGQQIPATLKHLLKFFSIMLLSVVAGFLAMPFCWISWDECFSMLVKHHWVVVNINQSYECGKVALCKYMMRKACINIFRYDNHLHMSCLINTWQWSKFIGHLVHLMSKYYPQYFKLPI
jgi:hypothetical protein